MKIAVWDTYVTRKDGRVMHFDIIVSEAEKNPVLIQGYGKQYLDSIGEGGQTLGSRECQFCHVGVPDPNWQVAIEQHGYYILKMENCT